VVVRTLPSRLLTSHLTESDARRLLPTTGDAGPPALIILSRVALHLAAPHDAATTGGGAAAAAAGQRDGTSMSTASGGAAAMAEGCGTLPSADWIRGLERIGARRYLDSGGGRAKRTQ
jgi:hypothetical protein